jgi:hypothetical protein
MSLNRRGFFALATFSFIAFIGASRVFAAACPEKRPEGVKVLELDSPVSKRLEYVEVAEKAKAHAKFTEGANCANCQFYQVARAKEGYAPCTMAGMNFVTACGWCNLYRVKPS